MVNRPADVAPSLALVSLRGGGGVVVVAAAATAVERVCTGHGFVASTCVALHVGAPRTRVIRSRFRSGLLSGASRVFAGPNSAGAVVTLQVGRERRCWARDFVDDNGRWVAGGDGAPRALGGHRGGSGYLLAAVLSCSHGGELPRPAWLLHAVLFFFLSFFLSKRRLHVASPTTAWLSVSRARPCAGLLAAAAVIDDQAATSWGEAHIHRRFE